MNTKRRIIYIFTCLTLCWTENESTDVGEVIGIDLGTTYCCVAAFANGKTEVIQNAQGNFLTPSYFALNDNGDELVGESAKLYSAMYPTHAIYIPKRFIGRAFEHPFVQANINRVPFNVTSNRMSPVFEIRTANGPKTFTPEYVSSAILKEMKKIAETYLEKEVTHAVITVPAYFTDRQRSATKEAVKMAGLTLIKLINEPTAAAIAYYGSDKVDTEETILVYDLGGGTFDISIIKLGNDKIEVLATDGDTQLGGEDFDERIMQHFINIYKKKGKDFTSDKIAMQTLRLQVQLAKEMLSVQQSYRIEIEHFFENESFSEVLTRSTFEEINSDLFKKTITIMTDLLKQISLGKNNIDNFLLNGGCTKIPKIRQLVSQFFNGKVPLDDNVNPDEGVAIGAAIQAAHWAEKPGRKQLTLLDVNSLSIGIEALGSAMIPIIPQFTVIPVKRHKIFTTVDDDQTHVNLRVYEGEGPLVTQNHFLGNFILTNIQRTRTPKIKVTIEIDTNGMLTVNATDLNSRSSNQMIITKENYEFPDEMVHRIINKGDAEKNDYILQSQKARHELSTYLRHIRNAYILSSHKEPRLTSLEKVYFEIDTWLTNRFNKDPSIYKTQYKKMEEAIRKYENSKNIEKESSNQPPKEEL